MFTKNKVTILISIFLLATVGLGCNILSKLKEPEYFESDTAQVAAEAIKEKIGKPFRVTEVFIDGKDFIVKAQDPTNPNNLDEYEYLVGFVKGPTPLKADGMYEDLERSSFPFDEIDFAAIPSMAIEAVGKSEIENAKVTKMEFRRGFSMEGGFGHTGKARWLIYISSERDSATAFAEPNGKVTYVDFSGSQKDKKFNALAKDELNKAQAVFDSTFDKDTRARYLSLADWAIYYDVPRRENPNKYTKYIYKVNGLFKEEVGISFGGHMQEFNPGEVRLNDVYGYIEKAKKRLELPNAVQSSLSVQKDTPNPFNKNPPLYWSIHIKDKVNEGWVQFDNKTGKEIQAYKNGKYLED